MIDQLTYRQAAEHSGHELLWRARLRSGEVIWEQPGVSSDSLPADQVVGIDYVPGRRKHLPTIMTHVDVDLGERFVRYWTNMWSPNNRGMQRLYVAGIQYRGRHALFCYYPALNRLVFSASRPFQPTWKPHPFRLLPPGAVIIGAAGTSRCGWRTDGFGGLAVVLPGNTIEFRAIHE